MPPSKTAVTELLLQWRGGDPEALDRLTPLVFDELHRIARGFFERERRDHTLQPTALVHEVYLRLVDARQVDWRNRAHFIGIAARLMRCVLVDHARRRAAGKRGGGVARTWVDPDLIPRGREVDLVALDDALDDLERLDPEGSQVVEMRFFGGLTHGEIAEVLGVSPTTVKRKWTAARAWLYRALK